MENNNAQAGNTSGQRESSVIPAEIKRWSWGGFIFTWVWGIFNNVYVALLALIPFVSMVMPFVLGAKGNEWAWREKKWDSVEHFNRVQKKWAIAGVILFILIFSLMVPLFISVSTMINQSEPYVLAMENVTSNEQVISYLGEPIERSGLVTGNISHGTNSGEASLAFPVKGPLGGGHVGVEATKSMETWSLEKLVIRINKENKVLKLID